MSQVKGWRDRANLPADFKLYFPTTVEQALLDEVADLRALLGLAETKPEVKDPRQMHIEDMLAPKFGDRPSQCACKPGQCQEQDARDCADWTKRGKAK